jgi:hypothetical protein
VTGKACDAAIDLRRPTWIDGRRIEAKGIFTRATGNAARIARVSVAMHTASPLTRANSLPGTSDIKGNTSIWQLHKPNLSSFL